MSNSFMIILAIVSTVIWIAVSKETVKPAKEINRLKMITLLSAGSVSAFVITITLFQSLSF
ncbi:hypothetical protein L1279_001181 [Planomicrobium sp. HSC-17F08]|nr:hypothetical protein [Planomicrobium sp. HSC-17F08]